MQRVLVSAFVCGFVCTVAEAQKVATTFSWPVNETTQVSQKYLEWNEDVEGYHLGIDLAGAYGTSVNSVANGKVVDVQNINYSDSWGKVVVIKHTLPDGSAIYSLYAHLSRIDVTIGATVVEGQKIAAIGNSNGRWPTHLHLELRRNDNWHQGPQGYWSETDPAVIAKYLNPTLFVDDRAGAYTTSLAKDTWTNVNPLVAGSMALTYVTYGNRSMSFRQAVSEGLVSSTVKFHWQGDTWWDSISWKSVLWFDTAEYRVKAKKSGVKLSTLLPSHELGDDRAIADMAAYALKDDRFVSIRPETLEHNGASDDMYYILQMEAEYETGDGEVITVIMGHATYLQHPLYRFVTFVNPVDLYKAGWTTYTPSELNY